LGCFLFVEELVLKGDDKILGNILVELDVHNGLLEALGIEWRGNKYGKKLDYLGLLFRCTFCHRTGHLRKDCHGIVTDEESKSPLLRKVDHEDSPMEDPTRSGEGTLSKDEVLITNMMDSAIGKLNHLCPSFFSTIPALELVRLNISLAHPKMVKFASTTPESPIKESEREGDHYGCDGSTGLEAFDQSINITHDCIGDMRILPDVAR
jgi:hypothetical protein